MQKLTSRQGSLAFYRNQFHTELIFGTFLLYVKIEKIDWTQLGRNPSVPGGAARGYLLMASQLHSVSAGRKTWCATIDLRDMYRDIMISGELYDRGSKVYHIVLHIIVSR